MLKGNEESRVFYSSAQWKRLAKQVKTAWLRHSMPCGYCKGPINRGERVIVDHVINRKQRPDLAFSLYNLQLVHHACNSKKYQFEETNAKPEIGYDGFPDEWR